MSKWNLKLINDCKEIKFGTRVKLTRGNEPDKVFLGVKNDNVYTIASSQWISVSWDDDFIKDFKFYRPDGTEILPPSDVKTKEEIEAEFKEKARELIKFLNDNPARFHPHHEIRITSARAQILTSELGFKCEDYLKD